MKKILTIFITLILVAGIVSLAKAADVDSSSNEDHATAYPKDRHIVKSSNGTIVVLYSKSNDLVARRSTDDGATWKKLNGGDGYTEIDGTTSNMFSICMDASDNIYVAYEEAEDIYFRKLAYNTGNWTVGEQKTVDSGDYPCANPSITIEESGGKVWIAYGYEANEGDGDLKSAYATDPYSSWSYTDIWPYDYGTREAEYFEPALVLRSTSPFVVYNDRTYYDLKWSEWNGSSWSTPGTITEDVVLPCDFSVTTIGSDVHLVYNKNNGPMCHEYYNGSWNYEATLSTITVNVYVSLTTEEGGTDLWCFISDYYAASQYNIKYKKRSGGTWDSNWTAITTDNAYNLYSTTPLETSSYIPLVWMVKTSPYPVKFDKSVTMSRTYTWDGGGATGVWTDADNWDLNDGYPDDKNDKAVINTGSESINTGAARTIGQLELGSSYSGTLTLGGNLTLDDSGAFNGNLTISNANAKLSLGAYNLTIPGTFSNNGTLRLRGGQTLSFTNDTNSGTVEYVGNGDAAVNTYTIKNFGTNDYYNLTINSSGTADDIFQLGAELRMDGTLTVTSGVLYLKGYSLLDIAGGATAVRGNIADTIRLYGNESVFWTGNDTDSGTYEYVGNGTSADDYSIKAFTGTDYYHLTVNSTLGVTDTFRLPTSNLTVAGNFTLTAGTFTTNDGTTDRNLSVTGNVDIDGTFNANGSTITVGGNWDSSGGTFNYDTSTVDLAGIGNLKTAAAYLYNLTCAAADKTTTLQSDIHLIDTLTLGSGTLTDGASSYTVFLYKNGGTPLINGGATITLNAITYIPASGTVTVAGGNYEINYLQLYALASNVTYNLGSDIVVNGIFYPLAVNGATNVVCNTQNNTIEAGNLVFGSGTSNGSTTLNCGTSTIDVGPGDVAVLDAGGSHTLNLDSATVTCAGHWQLVTGTGTITQNPGTSTVTLDGASGTQTVTSNSQSFYHLKIENTGTSVQLQDAADVDGGLIVTTGTLDLNSYNITISSDVYINGTLSCSSGEQITVGGNWSASSGATFTAGSSTTTFNGSGSFNILSSGTTFYNLLFNNNVSTWTLTDALYSQGDFTITNSGNVNSNSKNLTITGDFRVNGGKFTAGASTITVAGNWDTSVSANAFTYGTSTVDLTGTGNLTTPTNGWSTIRFYNLKVAAQDKTTTLLSHVAAADTLTIGSGELTDGASSFYVALRKNSGTPLSLGNATITIGRIVYRPSNGTVTVAGGNYGTLDYLELFPTDSNATFNLGGNVTVNGGFFLVATAGKTNVVCDTQDNNITATHLFIGDGSANGSTTFNCGSSIIDIGTSGVDMANNGGSHTFNLNTSTITCAGNWQLSDGTGSIAQNPGTSTVTFDGPATSTSTLTGSTTFYVLISTTTGKNVKFTSDIVIGVTNHLNFENITLRSTSGGATWYLNLSGSATQDVHDVDVQDSNASGGETIVAFGTNTDSGNNTNWDFGPPAAITDLTGLYNNGTGEVTLSWSTPGDDGWNKALADGSKYRIDYSSYSIAWSTNTYDVDIPTHSVTPHTEVSHTIAGLQGETTWYFQIWTQDGVSRWSGLSNGATVWVETIVSSVTVSAYTDGDPDVPPTYVYTDTTDNCLGTFKFEGAGTISSMTITEYGTCDADGELENVELYQDDGDGDWDSGQDTNKLGSTTDFNASNEATFSGFSLAASTYCYVHVVLDVKSTADSGGTVGIELYQNDIVCTSTTTASSWPVQLETSMIIGEDTLPSFDNFRSQNSTDVWITTSEWNDVLTPNTKVRIQDTGSGLRIGSQEVSPDTHTVLLMHLNNDTTDYSGHNNHGTREGEVYWISTDTWKTGVDTEDILSFEGDDDYIEISNPGSVLDGKNLTVSAWIYHIRSGDSYQRIVDRVYNGQFAFYIQPFASGNYSAGELTWALSTVGGDKDYYEGAVIVPEKTWTHVVLTYDGSDARIYVNGSLEDTYGTGISGGLSNSTDNIRIGQRTDVGDSRYFNGLIDEVRILDHELSADEIAADYYSGLFKYSTNGGSTWNPTNAWSTGTVTGENGYKSWETVYASNVPFNQYSETQNKVKFLISDMQGNIAVSYEYIVKIGSITVSAYTDGDPDVPPTYVYTQTTDCLGTFKFEGAGTISSMTITEYGTCDADGDLQNVELYEDDGDGDWESGQDTTKLGTTTDFNASNEATFSGFSLAASTYCYVHVVLDVKSTADGGDTIGIELYQNDIVCTSTTTASSWPVQLGTSIIGGETTPPSFSDSTFRSQNSTDVWITASEWNDDLTPNTRVKVADTGTGLRIGSSEVSPDTHTVLLLHLNNDTTDYSGNGNHGTREGGVDWISTDTWKTGGDIEPILYFDGDGDYVNVSGLDWTPTIFSVEWWHYPLTRTNYNQRVKSGEDWGAFYFHTTEDGSVYVGTDLDNRFTPTDLPANTVELNKWQQFAYTYDGTQGRFYKNGVLLAGPKNQDSPTTWGGFQIGNNDTSTINGLIDEVRILDRALTADEIAADYYSGLFKYSTNGGGTWNPTNAWSTGTVTGENGSTSYETIYASNVPFNQYSETENKIKFLVNDMNGNIAVSSEYIVKIGSTSVSAYTDGTPDVPPTYTQSTGNCLGTFKFDGTGTITGLTITEYGTCDADGELENVKLYKDDGDGDWESGQDTQLGSTTNFDVGDEATFSFSLVASTYCYVHVVLDVKSNADSGGTVGIELYQDNIVCTSTTTASSWPVQLETSMIIGEDTSPSFDNFRSQNSTDVWITTSEWNDVLTPNTKVRIQDTGSGLRIGSQEVSPDTHTVLLMHLNNDTTDYSGQGNDGEIIGSPSWVTGKFGQGLGIAASEDRIDNVGVDIGNEWTISVWFPYPNNGLEETGHWRTLTRGNGGDHQIIVENGSYDLGTYDNTGATGFKDCGFDIDTLSSGWHQITVTQTGGVSGTMKYYIDGEEVGKITGYGSTTDILSIGNFYDGGQEWGTIDEVVIWNYALSPDQVAVNYYSGLFKYSKDGGSTWYSISGSTVAWSTGTVTGVNGSTSYETIYASNVPFNQYSETENKIKFLVNDMNGNIAESSEYIVMIGSITVSAYTDGTPDVPPSTVGKGTTENCLGTFKFEGGGTISSMTITEYGTCDADGELENVELYEDDGDGDWESGQDINKLGSTTNFNTSDKATFSGFSLAASTYCYVHVVLDVKSTAQVDNTIGIDLYQNDIVCTSTTTASSWPVQLGTSIIGEETETTPPFFDNLTFRSQNSTDVWITTSEWNDDLIPNTKVDVQDTGTGLRIGSSEVSPDTHTVLLLHLNGDTTDYSGQGNNGTREGGVDWISTDTWKTGGDTEPILYFAGDNDYVEVSDSASLDITGELTISAWVKESAYSTDSESMIVSKGIFGSGSSNDDPYVLSTRDDVTPGTVRFRIANETVAKTLDAMALSLDSWYHIAAVYDTTTMKIYVNGSLSNETSDGVPASIVSTSTILGIGATQDGVSGVRYYFNGLIDEVRILDRALTADEIAADYYSGLFKYSTNGGSTWNPTNGWSTGTVTGENESTSYETVYASNVPFNQYSETQNKVKFLISDMQGNIAVSSEYTVMIGSITVSAYTDGTPDVPPTYVYTDTTDNCLGTFKFEGGGTISSMTITEYGTSDADGELENVELYEDDGDGNWESGQDTTKLGSTTDFNASNEATFSGFSLAASSYCYVHVVLDVKSTADSGGTVGIELYQNDIVCTSTTTASSWPVQLGISIIGGETTPPSFSDLTFRSQKSDDTWISTLYWNDDLIPNTKVEVQDTGSGLRIGSSEVSPDTHTVLLLHLNNDTTDYSGYGNNGTRQGGVVWIPTDTWKTGVVDPEDILYFDGKDDYVEVTDHSSLDITGNITVTSWIKYTVPPDDFNGMILRKGEGKYYLYSRTVSDELQFNLNANAVHADIPFSDLTDGVWYYIVGTYDGSHVKIYLDGVEKESVEYSTAIGQDNFNLSVGADASTFFNGLIDEVRILNRALTADEIAADYYSGLFKYSTNGGSTWNPTNGWSTGTVTGENGYKSWETVYASNVPFNQYSGTDNKVKFLISDMQGNIAVSSEYRVKIGSITVSAYTDGDPDVPPSTVGQGTTGNCLGTFKFDGAGTISSMTITEYGTCDADGDLQNVELYEDDGDGDWESGDDTKIGGPTDFNSSDKVTFSGFSLAASTYCYIHVVLDVKSIAQVDNTIGIELYQDDIVCTSTTTASSWPVQLSSSTIKDLTSPAAITDLTGLCDSGTGDVTLSWSTPGDDGWNNALADGSKYRIDYSSYSIAWSTNTYDVDIPTHSVTPHTEVSHTITGLQDSTTWYFQIWTRDEVANWSGLSNGATVWVSAADDTAPAAITDLTGLCDSDTGDVTLSWSTPGDDGWNNTLADGSKYRIDYSTYVIAWSTNTYDVDIPTHSIAPHTQVSHTINGLTSNSTYYFRIWTADEVPNWSGLSNGATVWVTAEGKTYTWTGGGAYGVWADTDNWSGAAGYPDDANDKAVINLASSENINTGAVLTIGELELSGSYSGTLTLGGALTLDDSGPWNGNLTIGAGTLDVSGSYYQINIDGNWSKTGGIFNSQSGTVDFTKSSSTQTLNSGGTSTNNDFYNISHSGAGALQLSSNNLEIDRNFTNSAGTFDAGTRTVNFTATVFTITAGTNSFHDVIFNAAFGNSTISGTLYVGGNLQSNRTENQISGNIELNGSGDQTITGAGGGYGTYGSLSATNITINKSGGSAILGAYMKFKSLTINEGNTFDVSEDNYTLRVELGFTNNGTFNPRSGTVVFAAPAATITPSTGTFNNVNFGSHYGDITISGTLYVKGNLSSYRSETYNELLGNIQLNGSGDQTISATHANRIGYSGTTITINKSSGTAVMGTNAYISNLTINADNTFNVAGNNLTVPSTFTNNGTLQLQGDESVSPPNNYSGSTVEYTATSSSRTIKNWTYQSLKINGAGGTFILGTEETLDENLTVSTGTFDLNGSTLTINGVATIEAGAISQGSAGLTVSDGQLTGTAVTVGADGTWSNTSTGNITLGAAVSNAGTITLDGDGVDPIIIASSDGAKQRNWQGSGSFNITDVNVSSQTCTGGTPAKIYAVSSTDGGNNTNWVFLTSVRYWVGGAGNWSDAANHWSATSGGEPGATKPGTGDTAIFDVNSGTETCTINEAVNIKGLLMKNTYSGTITQGANTITIGADNAVFSGGTFTGGTVSITVNGTMTISGTAFTSTSGTLQLESTYTVSSGAFVHNSGRVYFSAPSDVTITPGTDTYYRVEFDPTPGTTNHTISGTLYIAENLTVGGWGDVRGGTIKLNGTGDQIIDCSWGVDPFIVYSALVIDKASGGVILGDSLKMKGAVTIDGLDSLNLAGHTLYIDDVPYTNNTTFTVSSTGTMYFGSGTSGSFTITPGTSIYPNVTFECHGTETISGTFYIAGNLYKLQYQNLTGGTIELNGTGNQTINANHNRVIGSAVVINNSGGVVVSLINTDTITMNNLTINEGSIFDVNGKNLTSSSFTNNGTLQLQGDESVSTPTNNSGSTVEYTATSGSRPIKNWTYQSLKINGADGTFTLGTEETLGENLTVSTGTFDLNGFALSISSATTIEAGAMKTSTNTVTFGNGTGNDSVNITGGELHIESDDTSSDIVLNLGIDSWSNTGGTIIYDGSTVNTNLLSSLSPYNNLTIDSAGSTYTLDGDITVNGDLTINDGTLNTTAANNYAISVGGDWNRAGGTFTVNNSTVTFITASSTSTLTGSTTFYGLVSTATGKNVKVSSDTVIDVTGLLNFENITLRSTSNGATWYLNLSGSGTQDVSGVDVRDSNASGGDTIVALNSTDSGNNTNWDFGPPAAITDLAGQCDSDTGDVTLSWSTPGDDGWNKTLVDGSKYRIDYSSYSIQWSTTTYDVEIPTHSVAPHTEVSYTITGLTGGTTWYFQIWTQDEVPLWSGLSNGATVWVNPILSVSISTNTYDFGDVPMGVSTHTVSVITVTNEGNVNETYSLKISSVTLYDNSPSLWKSTNTTTGHNRFIFYAIFHGVQVSTSNFDSDDYVIDENRASTADWFSDNDGGGDKQTGINVPKGDDRKLWFRLDMPTSTTTGKEEKITVTITAGPE